MRRLVSVLLLATLGMLGALAPSAFGSANPEQASCLALIVSSAYAPGELGPDASSSARDPEAHPLGLNVISFTAHLDAAECHP